MSMHQPNADSCSNRSTIDSNIRLPVAVSSCLLLFANHSLVRACAFVFDVFRITANFLLGI
jgi:hypothetical protein